MFVFSSCPQEELKPEDITEVVTFSTSIKLSVGLSLLCHQCSFPLSFPLVSFSFLHTRLHPLLFFSALFFSLFNQRFAKMSLPTGHGTDLPLAASPAHAIVS